MQEVRLEEVAKGRAHISQDALCPSVLAAEDTVG